MADLIAYLFSTRYFDEPGNAERGKVVFVKKQCNLCHAQGSQGRRSIPTERSDLTHIYGPGDVESWTGDAGKDEKSKGSLAKNGWKRDGGPDGVPQSGNAIDNPSNKITSIKLQYIELLRIKF